jgi:hypothetical protein
MDACLLPGELKPHDYRAGVVEIVEDTYPGSDGKMPFAGRFKPTKLVKDGKFVPCVGDLVIWDRSNPSKPETSWWRHINRVIDFNESNGTFSTVGGNEGQKVRVGESHIDKEKLLGFVHYPQLEVTTEDASEHLSEVERQEIINQVGMFLNEMANTIWYESLKGKG